LFKNSSTVVNCRLKTDSDHLKVEEDKLKVVWHAAAIEKWLVGREQSFFLTSTGDEICWISWFTVGASPCLYYLLYTSVQLIAHRASRSRVKCPEVGVSVPEFSRLKA
jgi:hypothetical protein